MVDGLKACARAKALDAAWGKKLQASGKRAATPLLALGDTASVLAVRTR